MRNLMTVILWVPLVAFAFVSNTDVVPDTGAGPNIGPVSSSRQIDGMWDLELYIDVETEFDDSQVLGGEFVQEWFFVTSGNGSVEPNAPNLVYKLDKSGNLVDYWEQWTLVEGWGWRDLCYDGTYLYGSADYVIHAFDLEGNAVEAANILGPLDPCRALAYDPVTDNFWTTSFGSALYEIDRVGAVQWAGSSGLSSVYGLAWDDSAPDGPWLWLFDMGPYGDQAVFYKFDPINHTLTDDYYVLPLMGQSTSNIAGGAFFTDEYNSTHSYLGGVNQGEPYDQIFLLEMYPKTHVENIRVGEPHQFALLGNYPNPFNPSTTISYSLPKAGDTQLTVFDTRGRQVAILVNGYLTAGQYQVDFDANGLASGVYFYRLEANGQSAMGKMIFMK